jgi:chitinase domain-containing protein 1
LYFPTPASLAARVALAREWGVGLSIWELGQGMEAFFDLL